MSAFDIADSRLIIHIGWQRTLLDYTQESGRARRGWLDSEAVVVIRLSKFANPWDGVDDGLAGSFVESTHRTRADLDRRTDRVGEDGVKEL